MYSYVSLPYWYFVLYRYCFEVLKRIIIKLISLSFELREI